MQMALQPLVDGFEAPAHPLAGCLPILFVSYFRCQLLGDLLVYLLKESIALCNVLTGSVQSLFLIRLSSQIDRTISR